MSIDWSLDFMAVNARAEDMSEQKFCANPGSCVADATFCQAFAEGAGPNPGLFAKILSPSPGLDSEVTEQRHRELDALFAEILVTISIVLV